MTDIPAIVAEALAAVNAHDTNRFIKTFSEEGAVDDWGRVFRGWTEIRRWSDAELIGVKGTIDVISTTTSGHTTAVTGEVGGGGFNGPSTFTFTVDQTGTLINLMRISV